MGEVEVNGFTAGDGCLRFYASRWQVTAEEGARRKFEREAARWTSP